MADDTETPTINFSTASKPPSLYAAMTLSKPFPPSNLGGVCRLDARQIVASLLAFPGGRLLAGVKHFLTPFRVPSISIPSLSIRLVVLRAIQVPGSHIQLVTEEFEQFTYEKNAWLNFDGNIR